jgi:hypothetical protein
VSVVKDARDWYIMIHISLFGFGILGYAYVNPSYGVFAIACGTLTTVMGMYHWFTMQDDKIQDAPKS